MKQTPSFGFAGWIKFSLCLLVLLAVLPEANATHFRYGNVTWQQVSGNTIKFKISQGWRRSFFGSPVVGSTVNTGVFNYGDGGNANVNIVVTSVNTTEDWFYGEATLTRTYANPGTYTAFFANCCRISSLTNGPDGNFRVETVVNVGSSNNSPVSAMPPIVNVPVNTASAQFFLNASDPDGHALSYRLSTSSEMGINNPSGLSINSSTGLITFNTMGRTVGQLYGVGFMVSDATSRIAVDFIIRIVQQSTPPFFDYAITPANATVFQTAPGQPVSFTVKAQDNDPGSTVTLSAVGLPLAGILTPALPTTANPVVSTFSWTPGPSDLGSRVITFTAQDNNLVQATTAVTINVSMKPVFDVPPTPASAPDIVLEPGTAYAATIRASDPDAADAVVIDQVSGLPVGASYNVPSVSGNPTSEPFSWTPVGSQWGPHAVTFRAIDTYNDTRLHTVNFIVNTTPVFTSAPVTQVYAGQLYQYLITGLDPDVAYGDDLDVVSAFALPSWLTLTDNGDGTALLSGTPSVADAGIHSISIQLEDIYHHVNVGGIPHQDFTIEVIPCNIASTLDFGDVTCYGYSNAAIDLTVTGANAPVSFAWSNGATSEDLSGVSAGSYTVIITDAFGCMDTATVTISQPTELVASSSSGSISCFGGTTTVQVSAVGGTIPYLAGTGNYTVGAGTHSYTVIDANGCASVTTIVVSEPAELVASSVSGSIACNGGTTTVQVSAVGGTAPYSGTGDYTVGAGTHSYTVVDANGCTSVTTVVVTEPAVLVASSTSGSIACYGGTTTVHVSAVGGTAPYSGTGDYTVGAGTHSYTVVDANGCTSVTTIVVGEPTLLTSSINPLAYSPLYTCAFGTSANIVLGYGGGATSATLNSQVAGGTAPYSYSWSPAGGLSNANVANPVFTPSLAEGCAIYTFVLNVTDANGCTTSSAISVNVANVLSVSAGSNGKKVDVCHNAASQEVDITISTSAVPTHLASHGDCIGKCTDMCDGISRGEHFEEREVGAGELNVYPNPNPGRFMIDFKAADASAPMAVKVLDITGNVVFEREFGASSELHFELSSDMTNLQTGLYMVAITNGEYVYQNMVNIQK